MTCPGGRADALGAGLFGLYTNTSRTPIVADNVLMLWPEISEDARQRFGVQYGGMVCCSAVYRCGQ